MTPDPIAPDQPSPEAPPLRKEEPPPGVERRSCAPTQRPSTKAAASDAPRTKKAAVPPDWATKKRMIFFCILLLIANICVGTYLVLTWGKRSRREPEPVPVQTPVKSDRIIAPPQRAGDVG